MSPSMPRRAVIDLQSTSPSMALPSSGADRLRSAIPDGWELVFISSPTESSGDGSNSVSEETLSVVATAEVYFGYGLPSALVAAAPMLKWAHSASAGVGSSITPELLASGLVFTNSAGVYAEAMAESVMAGVYHFTRGIDHAVRQQAVGIWNKSPFHDSATRIREISELKVVVVGAGGIGSSVAVRLQALGATCIGVRRRPELGTPEGFERVVGILELDSVLKEADLLVLAAPLTSQSRGVIDRARIALLPAGAIVVNVARGPLLDTEALISALDSGHLRGAYLDVFDTEPLPVSSPLWSHPGVLITPHVSGVSPVRHWGRALALFEDNWQRWAEGKPLRNVVDPAAGY